MFSACSAAAAICSRGGTPDPPYHPIRKQNGICHRKPDGQPKGGRGYATDTEKKDFSRADEVRSFRRQSGVDHDRWSDHRRATLEPGWRWSKSVQPIAKTKSCEAPHFQYHVAGTLKVVMDDGTELVCKPGDVSLLPSGHDAWVVGNENVVIVDFQGMVDYAKKAA